MGHQPFVAVWDSTTCQTLATIPELHPRAISAMAFSRSADLLATVSLDEDHTISVYDWKRSMVMCRAYGGSAHVLDVCFSDDDQSLVTCGVKEIKFWAGVMSRAPTSSRPTLGEIGQLQPFLCCRYFAGNPTVGTSDGNLYIFVDNSLRHAVKAHDGAVTAMDVSLLGNLLVTGGKDGAVRIWSVHLECSKEITIDSVLQSSGPRVRSVAFSADANNLVIGTKGAEIFEIAIRSGSLVGKPLSHGHGCRELWGLATHPTKEEFVTSGDDATIRVWDSRSYSLIRSIKVDTASRAITYSPDGRFIVVGFGFGKRSKGKASLKEGAIVVLSTADMKIVHEAKDSNEPIRVVKFSPDSNILAVGSEDSCVYIYNAKDNFSRRATFTVHKAPIMYLDFTADGSFLMSVDSTKRTFYSEASSGMHIPSPATLREEKWATWSSPVGWPVQGMWMSQPPGVVPTSAQRSWGGMLLAMGSTAGRLMLAHNPCQERAGFISSSGHSGPISQVAWLAGDATIITTGAKDHAILQWRVIFDTTRESGDEGGISCEDSEVERDAGHEFKDSDIVRTTDNFGKTPQWTTAISPPSVLLDDDILAPSIQPTIDVSPVLALPSHFT